MYRFKLALTVILNSCLLLTSAFAQFDNRAETGPVGVYPASLRGSRTSLGAVYDKNQLTCAHKFYPSGTMLQVSRIDNDLSVVLEVNDRLSVKSDNVIVISEAAARSLNLDPARIVIVRIDPLGKPKNVDTPAVYYNTSPSAALNASNNNNLTAKGGTSVPQSYDVLYERSRLAATTTGNTAKLSLPSPFGGIPASSNTKPLPNSLTARTVPQSYDNFTAKGAPNTGGERPASYETTHNTTLRNLTNFYIQVAAFSNYSNAERYHQNLLRRGISDINARQVQKADGNSLYRLWIGPYPNIAAANKQKQLLAKEYGLRGLVIEDSGK